MLLISKAFNMWPLCVAEVLVNSAKVDLTIHDVHRNTALHLTCSKVTIRRDRKLFFFSWPLWIKVINMSPTTPWKWDHSFILCKESIIRLSVFDCSSLSRSQGHETCALLILEKVNDRNLINCTNAALQTWVLVCGVTNYFQSELILIH